MRSSSMCLATCFFVACHGSPPQPPVDRAANAELERACTDLLAAEPGTWTEQLVPLHAHGAAAAAPLLARLREQTNAPGAPAAIALLGRIGNVDTARELALLVGDRGLLATEAALALGELARQAEAVRRCEPPRDTLRSTVTDRTADSELRTAAACALVSFGDKASARALVVGIVLAGTPTGQTSTRALGLPEKPRWAFERYLVQRMLLQHAGDVFALDTDASWDQLATSARAIDAWFAQ